MPRGFLRWEAPAAAKAAGLAGMLMSAGASESLPAAVQPMAERDEAIFLLHTAAEIEHALLIQYLYAAFSFGDRERRQEASGGDLDPGRHGLVFGPGGWNRTIMTIAIEEMCHFITVQNVLRVLGGPPNLDREDLPFRAEFYPFPFALQAATKDSLAKYVAAEMPEAPDEARYPKLREILARADMAVDAGPINRVGRLFTRIHQLIGVLPESAFHAETADSHQAPAGNWQGEDLTSLPPNKRAYIVAQFGGTPAEAKAKVLKVLGMIAAQGEGPGTDAAGSHFDLFYRIYHGFPETNPAYGPVVWHPALPVPSHPNTSPQPHPSGSDLNGGRITHDLALLWAQLCNTRYRMLLCAILHSLLIDRNDSNDPAGPQQFAAIVGWSMQPLMKSLRPISNVLTRLPLANANARRDGRSAVAGAPFELPYTLSLPDRQAERWQWHRDLIEASRRLRGAIAADPLTQGDADALRVLKRIEDGDDAMLEDIGAFDQA